MVSVRECGNSRNPSRDLPQNFPTTQKPGPLLFGTSSSYDIAVHGNMSKEDQLQILQKKRQAIRMLKVLLLVAVVLLIAFVVALGLYISTLLSYRELQQSNRIMQKKIENVRNSLNSIELH